MNWLTNFIRPRIRSFVEQKDVPDDLWQKCPSCDGMLFYRDLRENLNVCYHCDHHLRLAAEERLKSLYDNEQFKRVNVSNVPFDPLKFRDRKKYADRLREARQKTGHSDAIQVVKGTIGGLPVVTACFDFSFMGGSMGTAVGEAIVKAAETAVHDKASFLVIPASGGARMQEGALSLMQMPRTTIAVNKVKEAGLPYIVLLTDPTTGGVSASFAMLGDIHMAEPGANIGFAGKRVIQETIREELPDDFQTAEYLYEHGMVDMVVPRQELRKKLMQVIGLLTHQTPKDPHGKDKKGKDNASASKSESAKKGAAGVKGAAKSPVTTYGAIGAKTAKVKTSQPANTNETASVKKKAEAKARK